MKRRYGKDVYGLSILQILSYSYILIVLLKKLGDGSTMIDHTALTILIPTLLGNISQSINNIRLQWQTNNAHQRVNKINREQHPIAMVKDVD